MMSSHGLVAAPPSNRDGLRGAQGVAVRCLHRDRHARLAEHYRKSVRHVLIISISLLLTAGCTESPTPRENVKIIPDETLKELPAMFQDEAKEVNATFMVRNTSSTDMHVSGIETSCNCTSARLEKSRLGPGEVTLLHMGADLSRRVGPVQLICTLTTDTGQARRHVVTTSVYMHIECSPERVAFGAIDPRGRAAHELLVSTYTRGGVPATPCFKLGGEDIPFRLELGKPRDEDLPGGLKARRTPISIRYAGDARAEPSGPRSVNLQVSATEGDQIRELEVPIFWVLQTQFEVAPSRVFFGQVETAKSSSREITIRRTDGRPFSITQVSSTHPAFRCRGDSRPAATEHSIVVDLDTRAVGRFALGKMLIQFDNKDELAIVPLGAFTRWPSGESSPN